MESFRAKGAGTQSRYSCTWGVCLSSHWRSERLTICSRSFAQAGHVHNLCLSVPGPPHRAQHVGRSWSGHLLAMFSAVQLPPARCWTRQCAGKGSSLLSARRMGLSDACGCSPAASLSLALMALRIKALTRSAPSWSARTALEAILQLPGVCMVPFTCSKVARVAAAGPRTLAQSDLQSKKSIQDCPIAAQISVSGTCLLATSVCQSRSCLCCTRTCGSSPLTSGWRGVLGATPVTEVPHQEAALTDLRSLAGLPPCLVMRKRAYRLLVVFSRAWRTCVLLLLDAFACVPKYLVVSWQVKSPAPTSAIRAMRASFKSVRTTHLCVLTGRAFSCSHAIERATASVVRSNTSCLVPATENSMSSDVVRGSQQRADLLELLHQREHQDHHEAGGQGTSGCQRASSCIASCRDFTIELKLAWRGV
eukprot:1383465-Amphidinium_carterae.3